MFCLDFTEELLKKLSLQIEIIFNVENLGKDTVAVYTFFKPESVSSQTVQMESGLFCPTTQLVGTVEFTHCIFAEK